VAEQGLRRRLLAAVKDSSFLRDDGDG
jgi:hypothetical protein